MNDFLAPLGPGDELFPALKSLMMIHLDLLPESLMMIHLALLPAIHPEK